MVKRPLFFDNMVQNTPVYALFIIACIVSYYLHKLIWVLTVDIDLLLFKYIHNHTAGTGCTWAHLCVLVSSNSRFEQGLSAPLSGFIILMTYHSKLRVNRAINAETSAITIDFYSVIFQMIIPVCLQMKVTREALNGRVISHAFHISVRCRR